MPPIKRIMTTLLLPALLITLAGASTGCDLLSPWDAVKDLLGKGTTSGVIVTTDKASYQQVEPILVRIESRLEAEITTVDQKSFCSIVRLERLEGQTWEPLSNCTSTAPVREIVLEGRSTTEVLIEPAGRGILSLAPGTYRVVFRFSPGDRYRDGDITTIRGQPFSVNSVR